MTILFAARLCWARSAVAIYKHEVSPTPCTSFARSGSFGLQPLGPAGVGCMQGTGFGKVNTLPVGSELMIIGQHNDDVRICLLNAIA